MASTTLLATTSWSQPFPCGHHATPNPPHDPTVPIPIPNLCEQQEVDEVHAPSLVALQPGLVAKAVEGLAPALHHVGGEVVHGGAGAGEAAPVGREAVEPRRVMEQPVMAPHHQGAELQDGFDVLAGLPV